MAPRVSREVSRALLESARDSHRTQQRLLTGFIVLCTLGASLLLFQSLQSSAADEEEAEGDEDDTSGGNSEAAPAPARPPPPSPVTTGYAARFLKVAEREYARVAAQRSTCTPCSPTAAADPAAKTKGKNGPASGSKRSGGRLR